MLTYTAIARRFKAGESIRLLASTIAARRYQSLEDAEKYVEHAIRAVMKRQERRHK